MNKTPDDMVVEYGTSKHFRIVYAKRKNGTIPAKDFVENLDKLYRTRFDLLFERLLQTGKIWNKQKFKKLQGDSELWEFISIPYRIFTFRDGNCWILTHGFEKRKSGTDIKEIEKGVAIKKEYFETLKQKEGKRR